MIQWVKMFVAKPEELSCITGTHMVGENKFIQVVFRSLHIAIACVCSIYTHTQFLSIMLKLENKFASN